MIKLNAETYKRRINKLPLDINKSPICFMLPKNKQIPIISINSTIFLYLFGYEFPETILIIYNKEVIILTSESKLNLIKELNKNLKPEEQIRLYNKENLQRNLLEIGKLIGQKVFLVEQLETSEFTNQCINYFINTNELINKEENKIKIINKLFQNLDKQEFSIYYCFSSVINLLIESINELIIKNMFRVYNFNDKLYELIDNMNLSSGYLNMNNEYILYEPDLVDFYKDNEAKKLLYNKEGTETNFDIYKYKLNIRIAQYCGKIIRTFSVNCKNRKLIETEETIEELINNLYKLFDEISELIHNKKQIPNSIINNPIIKNSEIKLNLIGLLPIYKTINIIEYNKLELNNIVINIILKYKNIEIGDIILINDYNYNEIKMGYTKNYINYKKKYNSIYLFNGLLNKSRLEKDEFFEKKEENRIELIENQKELLNNLIEKRIKELNNEIIKEDIKEEIINEKRIKRTINENLIKRSQSLIIDKLDINNIKINIPIMEYILSIPYKQIRNISILNETLIRINFINNPINKIKSINYMTNQLQKDIEELNSLKNIIYDNPKQELGKSLYKIEIKIELDFKMAKKLTNGILEFYNNCLTFIPLNSINNNKLILNYKDIKSSYYNIKQNDKDKYFIHFHLNKSILFNNRLTNNVQFYLELIEKICDTSKTISKKEEYDIEYEEMRLRNLYINQIKSILNILNNTKYQMGLMEQLGKSFPAILKENVNFNFTKKSLVCLDFPFCFIDLFNIEVICFERIISDNFDLVFISYFNKEFTFQNIFNINIKYLIELKNDFNQRGLVFIESKMNLNWNEVIKSIKNDLIQFYEAGAWKDLMEDDDEQSESHTELSSISSSESGDDISSADTEELDQKGFGKDADSSDGYDSDSSYDDDKDTDTIEETVSSSGMF